MHFRPKKALISFIEIAFVINLIILDIIILGKTPTPPLAATSQQTEPPITSPLVPTTTLTSSPSPTQQPITPTPEVRYIQAPAVKEYFVPFGSGQSTAPDWTNVTGLQAYIDSTQYPNIKSVVFEASVHIPTGNQSAGVRLFNATDQHPVWFSDVSMTGGTPQFLISQPITLDPGNKLYQVQMQTQLQYPAILDQARIHITLY